MTADEPRNGVTFRQWLRDVDRVLVDRIGLTHGDLADFNSRGLWADGVSPEEGADECMAGDDVFARLLD